MSRRERDGRGSDSRRHRSGFDREPSPKRSRMDGKPETGRIPSNTNLNIEDTTHRERKHQHRLQDALPLEAPSAADPRIDSGAVSKDSEKKPNENHEGSKRFSDPTDVPRSRSYFQHDERGNAAQVGRSFGRRATTDRRWKDSKNDENERAMNKSLTYDSHKRDGRPRAKGDDTGVHHGAPFQKEAEPAAAPVRKRPAFSEKKIPVDSKNAEKAAVEPVRPSQSNRHVSESERREERDYRPRYSDKIERPVSGDGKEMARGNLKERYSTAGGKYRDRERLSRRQVYHPGGNRAEKWKHDMFDEANKSPTAKNEEDQIAKIEALLAS